MTNRASWAMANHCRFQNPVMLSSKLERNEIAITITNLFDDCRQAAIAERIVSEIDLRPIIAVTKYELKQQKQRRRRWITFFITELRPSMPMHATPFPTVRCHTTIAKPTATTQNTKHAFSCFMYVTKRKRSNEHVCIRQACAQHQQSLTIQTTQHQFVNIEINRKTMLSFTSDADRVAVEYEMRQPLVITDKRLHSLLCSINSLQKT